MNLRVARTVCIIAVPILAAMGALAPIALPSQTDERLDALFDRLKTTHSEAEAARLTQQIWIIWVESESEAVNAFMAQGIAEMSRRHYEAALAAFNKVVEVEPGFAEGWNKRATVYYLMGDYEASIRDVERTLALEPRHFGALSGLGLISLAVGDDVAALQAFEAALRVNPYLPGARAHVKELRRRLRRNSI
ncbi:MAG: tetratricopeptide repeat protein [Candidatus Methylomirabilales bacterium]